MRHTWTLWAARAGVAAPALLVLAFGFLTVREHAFLAQVGWSPVHRTPTEWPSILALGPGGWIMTTAFAVCALLTATLATAAFSLAGRGAERAIAMCLGLIAVGLAGVSFSADLPDAPVESWHAIVHNTAYLLIPLGIMMAAGISAFTQLPGHGARASGVLLPLMLVFYGLTNLDSIAQLARYVAFAASLVWITIFTLTFPAHAENNSL